jgi:hypothetical protein
MMALMAPAAAVLGSLHSLVSERLLAERRVEPFSVF